MNDKARKWLRRAEEDLLALSQLIPAQTPDVVGMLCQQALEKRLKVCWLELGLRVPLSHDLRTLWSEVSASVQCDIDAERLREITPYGTRARYSDFDIPLTDAVSSVIFTLETGAKLKMWLEGQNT